MTGYVRRLMAGLFLLAIAVLPGHAAAEPMRVALVIGNGDYDKSIGRLRNPVNDAKLIAKTLKKLGFVVMLALDVDQKGMKRNIRDFGAALSASGADGVGFFYYAGHGIQVDGENYLLPIGAQIQTEGDVELEAVSANTVLAQMQFAHNSVNLIFLDACRNNPVSLSSRSSTRGLARVDAPRGSFVGYSTAPGDVAQDGEGADSPYALALAEELLRPGEAIEEMHRAVRLKVLAATEQKQTPWDSSSLTANVVLAGAAVAPVATVAPAPVNQGLDPAENALWENVKNSSEPTDYGAYLEQYPNGTFAPLARSRKAKLEQKTAIPQVAAMQPPAPAAVIAPEPVATPAPVSTPVTSSPALSAAAGDFGIVPMQGGYIATKGVNIRAEPNAKAKVLGKLKAQESVTVTGRTEDSSWLQIASADGPAYVSAKLLRPDPSVAARTAPIPEPEPAPASAPEPKTNALRLSETLREDVERFLANSAHNTGNYRFLAVNPAGDKMGVSIGCKIKKTSWGGYATNCGDEADARRAAADDCGNDCRVIFNGTQKIGNFEIEWVKGDGSVEAETVIADAPEPAPEPVAEPVAETPVQTASAAPLADAPTGDGSVLRLSESLRPDIEKFLANSAEFTGNYRFLAVNGAGDKLGVSIGCKIKKTSWGGYSTGCGNESDAKRAAADNCGSDCRVIFNGTQKIGRFEIEWY